MALDWSSAPWFLKLGKIKMIRSKRDGREIEKCLRSANLPRRSVLINKLCLEIVLFKIYIYTRSWNLKKFKPTRSFHNYWNNYDISVNLITDSLQHDFKYYYMINGRSCDSTLWWIFPGISKKKKKNFNQPLNRIVIKLGPVPIFRPENRRAAEYFEQNVSAYYQNWSSHDRITRSPHCTMECTMSLVSARPPTSGQNDWHRIALFDNGGFP